MSDRRSITRVTLRAIPLTPIHVGDGQPIRLDEYFIEAPERPRYDDDADEAPSPAAERPAMLCRFDQGRALRSMTAERRATFRRHLDQGNLGDAARLLREAGRGAVMERIALSDASRRELEKAIDDPAARTGQVNMFIRSGGRPFIPGSSIKGAFRTALASARLPKDVSPSGLSHERAMEAALDIDPNDTGTDPLRFLSVSDATLPEGSTRIDRTVILKRDGTYNEMQMHYERLRARSDRPEDRTAFAFSVAVDARLKISRGDLFQLVARYHWEIWRKERELFFAKQDQTKVAMDRILRGAKTPEGKPFHEAGPIAPNYLLLRLGRFGHFESKSLARVRQGIVARTKTSPERVRAPDEWGSTRTVTRNKDGPPIPFGWLLAWVEKDETL